MEYDPDSKLKLKATFHLVSDLSSFGVLMIGASTMSAISMTGAWQHVNWNLISLTLRALDFLLRPRCNRHPVMTSSNSQRRLCLSRYRRSPFPSALNRVSRSVHFLKSFFNPQQLYWKLIFDLGPRETLFMRHWVITSSFPLHFKLWRSKYNMLPLPPSLAGVTCFLQVSNTLSSMLQHQ